MAHRLRRKYEIMILDEEMTSMLSIVVLSIVLLSPRKTRLGEMDSSFDTFIMEWHRGRRIKRKGFSEES